MYHHKLQAHKVKQKNNIFDIVKFVNFVHCASLRIFTIIFKITCISIDKQSNDRTGCTIVRYSWRCLSVYSFTERGAIWYSKKHKREYFLWYKKWDRSQSNRYGKWSQCTRGIDKRLKMSHGNEMEFYILFYIKNTVIQREE